MKTILEISPDKETRYEMPDDVYDLVEAALDIGFAKTVKAAVANLPDNLRRLVEVTAICKPLSAGPLRGYRGEVLMMDDLVEWKQEYECEFIPPELKQRVDALGRINPPAP